MKNFKELKIWKQGMTIAKKCYILTATFPKHEQYNLSSQIVRCGVSIASNIAEGSSRTSEKDYARFVEISLGSAFELQTQLIIAQEIKMGDQIILNELLNEIETEQKMIASFLRILKDNEVSKKLMAKSQQLKTYS